MNAPFDLARREPTRRPPLVSELPGPAWTKGPDRWRAAPLVLLVDDEEDQREIYRQQLVYSGYRVAEARGGGEALERVLSLRPDVVVMDLSMPGIDGFEATRRIKHLPLTQHIPVIALTAYGQLPHEWAVAAGCDALLRKPCLPEELADELARVLAGRDNR